jgi:hypothetical protein
MSVPDVLTHSPEIHQILTATGATSYLDTTAAVRYLVYGNNSWISYVTLLQQ